MLTDVSSHGLVSHEIIDKLDEGWRPLALLDPVVPEDVLPDLGVDEGHLLARDLVQVGGDEPGKRMAHKHEAEGALDLFLEVCSNEDVRKIFYG